MTLLLPEKDFDFLADEKGKLAHIVNECCKKSLTAKWLVIEEMEACILIEVRYLEKLERDNLISRVCSYVDSQPRSGQRIRWVGAHNDILRIDVKWTIPELGNCRPVRLSEKKGLE